MAEEEVERVLPLERRLESYDPDLLSLLQGIPGCFFKLLYCTYCNFSNSFAVGIPFLQTPLLQIPHW